ncbi:MAG: TetR/AcrR family transcriptional regulator [Polyangiaceae bacterium]|nr:TetR/AcrR family transcriptional regulator [Polyangiaceae bacterium]
MPRPRFDNLEPQRKDAILDAAARELAARGPEHASLNKILADAGLSKGVAYYYFDDREDLFATVVSRVVEAAVRTIGGVGPVASADDFWREFRGLYERVLRFLRAHPTVAGIARRFASSPTALEAPKVRAKYDAFRLWFTEFLRRGQKVGALRTDLPQDLLVALALAWGEAMDRWIMAHWDDVAATDASMSAYTESCMGVFRRAFGSESEPDPPERARSTRPKKK